MLNKTTTIIRSTFEPSMQYILKTISCSDASSTVVNIHTNNIKVNTTTNKRTYVYVVLVSIAYTVVRKGKQYGTSCVYGIIANCNSVTVKKAHACSFFSKFQYIFIFVWVFVIFWRGSFALFCPFDYFEHGGPTARIHTIECNIFIVWIPHLLVDSFFSFFFGGRSERPYVDGKCARIRLAVVLLNTKWQRKRVLLCTAKYDSIHTCCPYPYTISIRYDAIRKT